MNRPLYIWSAFAVCLALVLGAMGWVSLTVLRLDEESAHARRQLALEENMRLALWRMDSKLATLVGYENARPYYVYRSFYPAERAYKRMSGKIKADEILIPSPLLEGKDSRIVLHFQFKRGGGMTSPQVPTGEMRDLATDGYVTKKSIVSFKRRLNELKELLDTRRLLATLPRPVDSRGPALVAGLGDRQRAEQTEQNKQAQQLNQLANSNADLQWRGTVQAQKAVSSQEWQARNMAINQMSNVGVVHNNPKAARAGRVIQAGMKALWIGEFLIMARRVLVGDTEYVQGAWLNWRAIKKDLLAGIVDLLPSAELRRLDEPDVQDTSRLAGLPVRLVPGPLPDGSSGLSPIQISMIIAWCCVLLAALAVAGLLRGAVSLSERRGAFVSAVTHELRTPLTTFRMYTEMLLEGMVTDEEKRTRYLETLQSESERLDHLVRNVLAYSRLERGSEGARLEKQSLGTLLEGVESSLAERARQAGMQLVVDLSDQDRRVRVLSDPAAFERIMFNLVDNACKFAQGAEIREIRIDARQAGGQVRIGVRDHGPGVSADMARRMFKPFSKSAKDAAESAPGVGLGLALGRRLARKMGGELELDASTRDGARLVLSLSRV